MSMRSAMPTQGAGSPLLLPAPAMPTELSTPNPTMPARVASE